MRFIITHMVNDEPVVSAFEDVEDDGVISSIKAENLLVADGISNPEIVGIEIHLPTA